MRRIWIIAATAALALSTTAPVTAQEPDPFITTLAAVMSPMSDFNDAVQTWVKDPFTLPLDDVDRASAALVATLDEHPPQACYAEWWADLRGSALLAGQLDDVWSDDMQSAMGYIVGSTFLISEATDAMNTQSCE